MNKKFFLFPLVLATPCSKAAALSIETEGKSDTCASYQYHEIGVCKDLESLEDDALVIADRLENKEVNFLLVATQNTQSKKYNHHLFSTADFFKEEKAVAKAKRKDYDIIQGMDSPHPMLQLAAFLGSQKTYRTKELYSNLPLCEGCQLMGKHLFGTETRVHVGGCGNTAFPSFADMPNAAVHYINDHLTLGLVEKLIVPCMGYVSGDKVKALEEESKSQITTLRRQLEKKEQDLVAQKSRLEEATRKLARKEEEISFYQSEIEKKDQQIGNLRLKVKEKDLIKNIQGHTKIAESIKTLREKYHEKIEDVDIESEESIVLFISKAIEFGKETENAREESLAFRKKYQGKGWQDDGNARDKPLAFYEKYHGGGYPYDDDEYFLGKKKMDTYRDFSEKFSIFSEMLDYLVWVLGEEKSSKFDAMKLKNEFSLKKEDYQMESAGFVSKLQGCGCCTPESCRWRVLD